MRHVLFSDLHVTQRSLPTCLEVLAAVDEAAWARQAGIIFLGDFWTVRGQIPVGPLNAVTAAMKRWKTQPELRRFIPGNHDQEDLGGAIHGVEFIQQAGLGICYSEPYFDGRGLWLPYRRDAAEALAAMRAHPNAEVIWCHIDVVGAWMNDAIQAQEGILPEDLPTRPRIYTGHYHRPHVVETAPNVIYVGSQYETGASEAGQAKRLLVVDDADWRVVEEIPIRLGARHFTLRDLAVAEMGEPQAGDRVRFRVDEAQAEAAMAHVQALRDRGVVVELAIQPKTTDARIQHADDLAPVALFREYANICGLRQSAVSLGEKVLTS